MGFELKGKLLEVYDEVQVSEKFKKKEFIVEKEENGYKEPIKFQLVQDRVDMLDYHEVGSVVIVSFDIKGNKWKENHFVNLQAWRIASEEVRETRVKASEVPDKVNEPEETDDLPF